MEIQDISKIINMHLVKLKDAEIYKRVLFKGNNLIRFDILNRILIDAQYKDAFDIRTYSEWEIEDRVVDSKAKPIYIVMPRYQHKYVDADTGNEVNTKELNIKEFDKALKYGIIKKDTKISHLYTIPMYDIKQTKKSEHSSKEYEVNKPVVSSSSIIDMALDIMNCKVDIANLKDVYFNSRNNTLIITKLPYKKLVSSISRILAKYYINCKIEIFTDKACEINYVDLTDNDINLIDVSIQYCLNTLLSGEDTLGTEILGEILSNYEQSMKRVVDIVNIVDMVMFDITKRIQFSKEFNTDAIKNVHNLRKANMLFSEMEASEINSMLLG